MSPATRTALGLPPLPAWQANRIQAQHAVLRTRPRHAWPAGCTHLEQPAPRAKQPQGAA
jgi:hypothetical protein